MACSPPYVPMTEDEERKSDERYAIKKSKERMQRKLDKRRKKEPNENKT